MTFAFDEIKTWCPPLGLSKSDDDGRGVVPRPPKVRVRRAPVRDHVENGTLEPSVSILDTPYIRNKKQRKNKHKLDNRIKIDKKKRIGHYYNALKSGMIWNQNKPLCHLVLTSPVGARDISVSFNHLRLEIKRLTVGYLLENGYLTKYHYKRFYDGREPDSPIEFEYLALKTDEGNGVYHIITSGDYLPVSWLQPKWSHIHGVGTGREKGICIRIRHLNENGDAERIQSYVMGHYLTAQRGYVNHSQSRGWLFNGYRRQFKKYIKEFGYDLGILYWDDCMSQRIAPRDYLMKNDYMIGCQRRPYEVEMRKIPNVCR